MIKTRRASPKTNNCVHLTTDTMTYSEIIKYVNVVYEQVIGIIRDRYMFQRRSYVPECKFKVNMPSTKTANARGFCFVWVPREVFQILIGNNYDGTPISDEYIPSKERLAFDWSCNEIISTKYFPPVFIYKDKTQFTPKFSEATVENRLGSDYIEGTLRCMNAPSTLSIDEMLKMFTPFSRGTLRVVLTNKYFDIIFGDCDCAYFALYMMKKHFVNGKDRPLIFDHARRY